MVPAASFDLEKAPFLDGDGSSAALNAPDEHSSSSPQLTSTDSRISAWSKIRMRVRPWMIHVVIIVFYTVLFFALIYTHPSRNGSGTTLLWSPAQNAVDWETRVIDAIPGSTLYAGFPNAESDTAWSELLRGINLKIFPEEMKRLGYDSLKLKDGSGYVASLAVYHELHCIKRVRKMIYRDYYYPNITESEWVHRMGHIGRKPQSPALTTGRLLTHYYQQSIV
ncbi:hypothetical protein EKO27_g1509 [Xylaria grammica]|uniref:Uncharacterized protein n=1 Tax=Xylaria grammica TaxID=363999 RepID=A0A439DGS7_9PEZI|nr:hypothetical protein EKO27_g1509 [Xylaria grammica]